MSPDNDQQLNPQSYYLASTNQSLTFDALKGDIDCDVCIIGAGFTGLSAAIHLAESGHKVVVLEAHKIAWGASGRNGGQVCTGQRLEQASLEKILGVDKAKRLWQLSESAKSIVKERIQKHQIDCDYAPGILHLAAKKSHIADIKDDVEKLNNDYDYDIEFLERDQLSDYIDSKAYYGGSLDWGGGHFHPLNYALGLAKAAHQAGVQFFENTKALSYAENDCTVKTEKGRVKSKKIIIACNGYLEKLSPRIAGNIMPINNFILTTKPLGEQAQQLIKNNVAIADSFFVVNYYRLTADGRLLFGGGETYSLDFPSDIKSFVRKNMLHVFPQLADIEIDYAWGGTLAITMNRLPDIGNINHNVYYSQGYSGHGVAIAHLVGKLMADSINGNSADYDLMKSMPTPKFPGGTLLRRPGMLAGMLYYSFLDKIGR